MVLKCSDQFLNPFILKYRKLRKIYNSVNDYKANILKTTTRVKRKTFPVTPQVFLCVLSPPQSPLPSKVTTFILALIVEKYHFLAFLHGLPHKCASLYIIVKSCLLKKNLIQLLSLF